MFAVLVVGVLFTILGVVLLANPDYRQPGTVNCNGHPMGRDEICRYYTGRDNNILNVENYDEKLAHQATDANRTPWLLLIPGLFLLSVGGVGLLLSYRRPRGSPG